VVVFGSGPDFVKAVLDAGAGASLADEDRYDGALERVGAVNTGITYLDIAAFRGVIERLMADASAEERADYDESVKPFLTPFDIFASASTVGGEVDTQRTIVTVK